MILLKLLALGYIVFLLMAAATYLVSLYERARSLGPDDPKAHVHLLSYVGQALVEAGANYLGWLLWPFKYLDRATPVRLAGTNRHPVLFVHGYAGRSSDFLVLRSRLRSAGLDSFATYNYQTTSGALDQMVEELARQVERVKLETGAESIDVLGFSLGGLVLMHYLSSGNGSAHVRKAIFLGSPLHGTQIAPLLPRHAFELFHPEADHFKKLKTAAAKIKGTKLVSIYSTSDNLVFPPSVSELGKNGTNHELHELGHNTLLFSGRVVELLRSELAEV